MSNPMIGKLIAKELSLNRMFMGAAIAGGIVSLLVCLLGKIGFAVGGIMLITVLVAYGVILPMYAIVGERKERTRLFALSLPVSRGEYVRAKVLGVTLSFIIPWAVLLTSALALILATPIPDGLTVFTTLLMLFALADFSIIVCAAMLTRSEGVMATVIIFTNMSVTFFMSGILNLTSIGKESAVDAINWSTPAVTTIAAELAAIAIVFGVLLWITGREPEVV